jgi:hypothetical protein
MSLQVTVQEYPLRTVSAFESEQTIAQFEQEITSREWPDDALWFPFPMDLPSNLGLPTPRPTPSLAVTTVVEHSCRTVTVEEHPV